MVYIVRFVVDFFVYFVHVDVDVECFLSVRAKKGISIGCFIALYIDKIIRLHFSYESLVLGSIRANRQHSDMVCPHLISV